MMSSIMLLEASRKELLNDEQHVIKTVFNAATAQ
jgi:hypothetical protein